MNKIFCTLKDGSPVGSETKETEPQAVIEHMKSVFDDKLLFFNFLYRPMVKYFAEPEEDIRALVERVNKIVEQRFLKICTSTEFRFSDLTQLQEQFSGEWKLSTGIERTVNLTCFYCFKTDTLNYNLSNQAYAVCLHSDEDYKLNDLDKSIEVAKFWREALQDQGLDKHYYNKPRRGINSAIPIACMYDVEERYSFDMLDRYKNDAEFWGKNPKVNGYVVLADKDTSHLRPKKMSKEDMQELIYLVGDATNTPRKMLNLDDPITMFDKPKKASKVIEPLDQDKIINEIAEIEAASKPKETETFRQGELF